MWKTQDTAAGVVLLMLYLMKTGLERVLIPEIKPVLAHISVSIPTKNSAGFCAVVGVVEAATTA
jgi:hypothetical protein